MKNDSNLASWNFSTYYVLHKVDPSKRIKESKPFNEASKMYFVDRNVSQKNYRVA